MSNDKTFTVRAVRLGKVVRFERPTLIAALATVRRLGALGWTIELT